MAYMSQENKKQKQELIKPILKKYGIKATLAVRHYSTLVLNIQSGGIDFIKNFNTTCKENHRGNIEFRPAEGNIQVNEYWYHEHFSGIAKDFLTEVIDIMYIGNHDNSEPQTDFFDVGWYCNINIGQWDKPYICTNANIQKGCDHVFVGSNNCAKCGWNPNLTY